eukprot:CAMPEP_0184694316 /NCGR_PEP_ID=MMETSP0313-20130426/2327_1 /TAXON_ID=2792 /ORGANISM="Porphyridium aerugineum, Strain SAG 1380-2" /LENGTH=452 /DNA_ID=CAMNT_0027152597 /DNA_START=118 /DNA_END=1476 /DNA_ORIENTATION=+
MNIHDHEDDNDSMSDDHKEGNDEDVLYEVDDGMDNAASGLVDEDEDEDEDGEHDDENDEEGEHNMINPERDDAVMILTTHTSSVFAVAAFVKGQVLSIVSGGGDDLAIVYKVTLEGSASAWSSASIRKGIASEVHYEIAGFEDSISAIAYDATGEFVAMGAMNGNFLVYRVDKAELIGVADNTSDAIEWIDWHPKGKVVMAGCADGMTYMWSVGNSEGELKPMMVFASHGDSVTVGGFTHDGKRIFTASLDGTFVTWDPRTGSIHKRIELPRRPNSPDSDMEAVLPGALCMNRHESRVIVGCVDGTIHILSLETERLVASLDHSKNADPEDEIRVESILIGSEPLLAVSGASDGSIVIWDLALAGGQERTRIPTAHAGCVTKLAWIGRHVFASSGVDGKVKVWNAASGECLTEKLGHHDAILDMKVVVDPERFKTLAICASDDCTTRIFALD